MVRPLFTDAISPLRTVTFAALTALLAVSEAGAQPGAGAPIVFAGREAPARAQQVSPPPARVQYVSTNPVARRAAPVSSDQPDVLYGYGSSRHRGASAPIDLRGTPVSFQQSDTLGEDAFEDAIRPEAPQVQEAVVRGRGAVPTETAIAPSQTSAQTAPSRPEWLERERTGAPYQANGQWFVPTAEPGYSETGSASWYGADFQGRPTASGELFDSEALTAAHPTLPIPSLVQVTNLENGREVIVRVNDRGPFHAERLIDVSRRTAEVLGFERAGQARVNVRYLGPAPKRVSAEGSDIAPAPQPAVVAAAPVKPRATERAVVSGGYFIQVGAFSNPANVERARAVLGQAGAVSVDLRQSNGAALQRVRVGSWPTRSEAEAARETVASLGYPGAVVAEGR